MPFWEPALDGNKTFEEYFLVSDEVGNGVSRQKTYSNLAWKIDFGWIHGLIWGSGSD
jgi:hypothetical protein